jgi:hypothetical protein
MDDRPTSSPSEPPQASPAIDPLMLLRGLAGAIAGGVVGYFLFHWLAGQRIVALVIPGALVGLGCGYAIRGRNQVLGIICAVAALVVGVYSAWTVMAFVIDPSLSYFVTHLHELPPIMLLMLALGGVCGYWFGIGR